MIRRRHLLRSAIPFAVLPLDQSAGSAFAKTEQGSTSRVRPGDPRWPSPADWDGLRREVNGNLMAVQSPLTACRAAPDSDQCRTLFKELKNPYFIGDNPALTQTCGWVDAWTAQPSAYAVAARRTADVVAAINFTREKNLRLVVKGGGHSYLGTSNAPDSLMIWTRAMNGITVHDAFVPQGCSHAPLPAVSIGAGAIWIQAYDAVTTGAGRYVQGGGCVTVGVAGLVQGGGFGTHSKRFGLAAASLLEAEVVTPDGLVRVVNSCRDPELFWALKGGGGGTFGVVTRMTLRTWDLPKTFGLVSTEIRAVSDGAYYRLLGRFVSFYAEALFNPHWGELARILPGNRLRITMNFQGLDRAEVIALWQPFRDWVAAQTDLEMTPLVVIAGPGRHRWDEAMLAAHVPDAIRHDDRPVAPAANFFWSANLAEVAHVIYGYNSLWMPAALLQPVRRHELVDALMAASRHWGIELHFQKGLAGAPSEVIAAAGDTPMNPDVTGSFMLAIIGSEGPPGFPDLPGHTPDVTRARRDVALMDQAMAELRKVASRGGAYVAESSYFQADWQAAYWGSNYPRLLAVKRRYDPEGLFFVRHGVGSEGWSEDGFTRL